MEKLNMEYKKGKYIKLLVEKSKKEIENLLNNLGLSSIKLDDENYKLSYNTTSNQLEILERQKENLSNGSVYVVKIILRDFEYIQCINNDDIDNSKYRDIMSENFGYKYQIDYTEENMKTYKKLQEKFKNKIPEESECDSYINEL